MVSAVSVFLLCMLYKNQSSVLVIVYIFPERLFLYETLMQIDENLVYVCTCNMVSLCHLVQTYVCSLEQCECVSMVQLLDSPTT